ncbi:ATP-binding protein [Azospirillum sp. sgz302134]
MTLLVRLFLLVGIAMLPAVAIQASHEVDLRRSRWDEVRAGTMRYAELMAAEQARIIDGAKQMVTVLSQARPVRTFDSERCHDYFGDLLRQFPQYALIDAMDINGQGMCAGQPGNRNNVADRAWFRLAVANNAIAIGEYVFGKQSRKHSLHVSHPLYADDGTINGVVGAAIDLDWFSQELGRRPLLPGMSLVVADRKGTVLTRELDGQDWIGKSLPLTLKQLLYADRPGTVELTGLDGRDRVVSYLPLGSSPQDLFVAVGLDREVAFADLNGRTWRGTGLIVVGMLLALLCAWGGARIFLLAPVRRMGAAVQRWKDGDLAARTGLRGGRNELSILAGAFDDLADALQDREARRAEAEEARRHSEHRYRFMAETIPQIVWTAGPDGAVDFINTRLADYLGADSTDQAMGWGWSDILHPDDVPHTVAAWDRARRDERPLDIEYRIRRHDGAYRWHLVRALPMRDGSGAVVKWFGSTTDIHDRRLHAEALQTASDEAETARRESEEARAAAERANLAKSKFLAAASHDLRQPLQSLFLFSAALAGQVESEKARGTLVMLDRGLETLKALLDSLLDVSRLDAGVIKPEIVAFPLGRLLGEIRDAYTPVAASQGLEFIAEDCCNVPVRSDWNLLGRVLRNFVENALRYTKQGRIRLTCLPTSDGRIRIEVQDTGIGIPADQLEKIFEEFHQVGNTERDRGQGLGLGLAIVKRISDLLGHEVRVMSAPGRGSVFAIQVPVETVALEPVRDPVPLPSAQPSAQQPAQDRFAALVDDDAIVLLGLQAMFQSWNYDVLIAGSADQLMQKLEQADRRPDIVIADYRLRDGRIGTEAILRVRERFGRGVPGIILTGETGPECQHDAAAHELGVVHKPVTPRHLQGVIDRFLLAAE